MTGSLLSSSCASKLAKRMGFLTFSLDPLDMAHYETVSFSLQMVTRHLNFQFHYYQHFVFDSIAQPFSSSHS